MPSPLQPRSRLVGGSDLTPSQGGWENHERGWRQCESIQQVLNRCSFPPPLWSSRGGNRPREVWWPARGHTALKASLNKRSMLVGAGCVSRPRLCLDSVSGDCRRVETSRSTFTCLFQETTTISSHFPSSSVNTLASVLPVRLPCPPVSFSGGFGGRHWSRCVLCLHVIRVDWERAQRGIRDAVRALRGGPASGASRDPGWGCDSEPTSLSRWHPCGRRHLGYGPLIVRTGLREAGRSGHPDPGPSEGRPGRQVFYVYDF